MKKVMMLLAVMIMSILIISGCGSSGETVDEEQSTSASEENEAEEVEKEISEQESTEEESTETDTAESDEAKEDEYGKGGDDLSNAERTTNENGDDVFVTPMGEEGKIRHWQHQYSVVVKVNDFFITDILPDEVTEHEAIKEAGEGETQAVVDVTFKNDGEHAEYYQGDGTFSTNFGHEFTIRPDLERKDASTTINDGGNVPFIDGEMEDVTLNPGEEQQVYLVFPIDQEYADEDSYYLSNYYDLSTIYAWELQ
ncbi:DUF4352 domain-containing protein [Virgibacillus ainsalahensis]